jgi:hypothetical protein
VEHFARRLAGGRGGFGGALAARARAEKLIASSLATGGPRPTPTHPKHRPTRRSMMIRLLFFVALVLVLGFGFAWLADRPGDLFIVWQDRRIEMSLMTAVTVMVSLVAAIMITWWLIRTIWQSPRWSAVISGPTSATAAIRRCRPGFWPPARAMP